YRRREIGEVVHLAAAALGVDKLEGEVPGRTCIGKVGGYRGRGAGITKNVHPVDVHLGSIVVSDGKALAIGKTGGAGKHPQRIVGIGGRSETVEIADARGRTKGIQKSSKGVAGTESLSAEGYGAGGEGGTLGSCRLRGGETTVGWSVLRHGGADAAIGDAAITGSAGAQCRPQNQQQSEKRTNCLLSAHVVIPRDAGKSHGSAA